MNNTIKYNYKTLTHKNEAPPKRKSYEWLEKIAAVNEAARAAGESYGQYVSRLRMIRLAESKKFRIPDGYMTAREWDRIRKSPRRRSYARASGSPVRPDHLRNRAYTRGDGRYI